MYQLKTFRVAFFQNYSGMALKDFGITDRVHVAKHKNNFNRTATCLKELLVFSSTSENVAQNTANGIGVSSSDTGLGGGCVG